MNDRAALELALAANPDDFATHAAYADLLAEQGDPRGDYIRLQLALEDRQQPVERLRAMEQEAFDLSQRHQAEWLGPLAEHVSPGPNVTLRRDGVAVNMASTANVQVTYRRGWLDTVRVHTMTPAVGVALLECPIGRLTAGFTVEMLRVPNRVLQAFPNLVRLSVSEPDLRMDRSAWFHQLVQWGQAVHWELAIDRLPRLRYLNFRSRDIDDASINRLIRSGLLDQLRGLDLCQCAITDDGAQSLAEHPAVAKFEYLHLDGNHISPIGIDALAAVGVVISQRQRLGPTPGDDDVEVADGEIEF